MSSKTNTKIKKSVTNQEAVLWDACLSALDGRQVVVVGEGGRQERGPLKPYGFTQNPDVYIAVLKNKAALASIVEAHTRANNALVIKHAPKDAAGVDPVKSPKEFSAYARDSQVLGDKKHDVELFTILFSDLEVGNEQQGKNPIPSSVVTPLVVGGIVVME